MAGATPLGFARAWSHWQESKDRVLYPRTCHDLQPGTQLVSNLRLGLDSSPTVSSFRLQLLWLGQGVSVHQVGFPRPTVLGGFSWLLTPCREGPQRREGRPQLGPLL